MELSNLLLIALGVFFLVLIAKNIRIVPQASVFILERLGTYKATWSVGLHVKIPFLDTVSNKISMKERVVDFMPQPVITKDNVTMMIDTVLFFQVTDPKLYTYGMENPLIAIENLSATSLRNVIGALELDQTLTSRDVINVQLRSILDKATDAWGIKINRVELKNINPPKEILLAMEKQMKAERERREAILRAEGEKASAILTAEGMKESTILRAEAEKIAAIQKAEGDAQALLTMQRATAEGIRLINQSQPTSEMIALRSLEALEKMADGQATKIIIPSDIQKIGGLAVGLSELLKGAK